MNKLSKKFFEQDALTIAPRLLGKKIVRVIDGKQLEFTITELEVYLGEEDTACHASKGRTARTEVMYAPGGLVYVYLIYGMYWMLNVVTGSKNHPQAILIRSVEGIEGPGRVGKALQLDKSFYGEDLTLSSRIWVSSTDEVSQSKYTTSARIGIHYATDEFKNKPWRYTLKK